MEELLKNRKGITLIALVITIIVLLILAGVTIATLTGDNGILTQAGKAKEKNTQAEIAEKIKLAVMSVKINSDILDDVTREELKEELMQLLPNAKTNDIDTDLEIEIDDYKYLINRNLRIIEKIEGNVDLWEYDKNNRTIKKYLGHDVHEIEEIVIPNYINGTWINKVCGKHNPRASIFEGTEEENNNIVTIKISEGIKSLEWSAFWHCKALKNIEFPDSLVVISNSVFSNCTSLTGDLVIPNNVSYIGQQAFDQCKNLNGILKIGNRITKIDTYAFAGCKFENVIIDRKKGEVTIMPGQCFKSENVIWSQ